MLATAGAANAWCMMAGHTSPHSHTDGIGRSGLPIGTAESHRSAIRFGGRLPSLESTMPSLSGLCGIGFRTLAITLCSVVLAGCAGARGSSVEPQTSPATLFTTSYGQDASLIAAHIPGCAAVTAQTVSAGSRSSARVISTCTLSHHRIVIYGWPDPASESQATLLLSTSPPSYSARGPGWMEIIGDEAPLDVQQLIADVVAKALGGTVTEYP